MKLLFAWLLPAVFAAAQTEPHPTGPRITPPNLNVVSPLGIARGTTAELTVEGLNLTRASAIYFSEPSVKGRILRVKELPDLPDIRLGSNGTPSTIDVGPLPPRNQATVEVDVAAEAPVGPVRFRLLTPLGTSLEGVFLVEPYFGESPDREPNDSPDRAFETFLPTVLTGVISRTGDVDYFRIRVKAGDEIVLYNQAVQIGSTLQPVVRILAEDQSVVREFGYDGGNEASRFAVKFDKAGDYYIAVTDYERTGRPTHSYRILAGSFPLVTGAYPLGLPAGREATVTLTGYNLGAGRHVVKGEPAPGDLDFVRLRPQSDAGLAFNEIKLDPGADPEIESSGANHSAAEAQPVTLPVTINGRIEAPRDGVPVENYFRFRARKGEKLIFEVKARRFGSDLDSFLEVLDAGGKSIEQAVARAVWQTFVVLRDHDSAGRGIRIQAWNVLNAGDFLMIGNEIGRVEEVPDGPDEDLLVESFGGQRKGFFGTTPEAHGLDRAVYKVQIHPPGARFSPNGLPLAPLYYRNDDGGPGFGKDSCLEFTAPADGEYLVRLRDVRGFGGNDFAYRLNMRSPRPDFRLAVSPRNPNVPLGGTVPVTVTALRLDGFDGPIELSVDNLPPGIRAGKHAIPAGQDTATVLLSADADARLDEAAPFVVTGHARISGHAVARKASPEDKTQYLALMPKPDILVFAETKIVELEPGGQAEVSVRVERQNGFAGRVPVQVRDLPPRVRVTDSGLNGVLITEDESRRSFKLWALPNAEPAEQMIYLAGAIETRSPQQSAYASIQPVLVRVRAGKPQAGVTAPKINLRQN